MQRLEAVNFLNGTPRARRRPRSLLLVLPFSITIALFVGSGCSSGHPGEQTSVHTEALDLCDDHDDCFPYVCVFDPNGNWCQDYCRNPTEPSDYCHPDAYCWESEPICHEEPEGGYPDTCSPYAYADPCPSSCDDDDDCMPQYTCEYTPFGNVCG